VLPWLLVGLAAVLTGCSATRQNISLDEPRLRRELQALGPAVMEEDAARLASGLLLHNQELSAEYRMSGSSNLHNIQVNLGLRERGLCWHFAVDLLDYARSLDLRSFDYYWAVAHAGYAFKEHSVLVVTARGLPFESGLVIDGWRKPWHLTWVPVKEDSLYPWKPYRRTVP
jgi:hypothetical protein